MMTQALLAVLCLATSCHVYEAVSLPVVAAPASLRWYNPSGRNVNRDLIESLVIGDGALYRERKYAPFMVTVLSLSMGAMTIAWVSVRTECEQLRDRWSKWICDIFRTGP